MGGGGNRGHQAKKKGALSGAKKKKPATKFSPKEKKGPQNWCFPSIWGFRSRKPVTVPDPKIPKKTVDKPLEGNSDEGGGFSGKKTPPGATLPPCPGKKKTPLQKKNTLINTKKIPFPSVYLISFGRFHNCYPRGTPPRGQGGGKPTAKGKRGGPPTQGARAPKTHGGAPAGKQVFFGLAPGNFPLKKKKTPRCWELVPGNHLLGGGGVDPLLEKVLGVGALLSSGGGK